MRLDIFKGFELQTMIFDYETFQFKRMHRGAGEMALTLNNFEDNDYLVEDNIVLTGRDAYIIEGVHCFKDGRGKLTMEISGRHINSLLARRIVQSVAINTTDTIEAQLYRLVADHFINPAQTIRKVENFYNAPSKGLSKKATTAYTLEKMTVMEIVNTVCGHSDLGYRINFDPERGRYEFEVYVGRNLSDSVFFGEEYKNVSEAEIYRQSEEYRNAGLQGGNWLGDAMGLDRRETFLNDDETLGSYPRVISVDGVIMGMEQFVYGVDWDLGDVVAYADKVLGFEAVNPVLEIQETHGRKSDIEVTFGERVPTIFDKVKG